MATCTRPGAPLALPSPPAAITDSGREGSPWLPAPEKDKPLARLAPAPAVANRANPGKKMRGPLVQATKEEQQKLMYLADRHQSGIKLLKELLEQRKELRKHLDDLLFRRRCVTVGFVNRIVVRDLDEAYVRHQIRIGLKRGDPLPEELKKARAPITFALLTCAEMRRAMDIGMDKYLVEYCTAQENEKKKMMEHREKEAKAEAEADHDQNGASVDPIADK